LHHIHSPTPFPDFLLLVPTPQTGPVLFSDFVNEKKNDIFVCLRQIYREFPCDIFMYICIIT
jgi:hypothetical protein